MTLEAQVLGDDAVRAAPGGYEVDLHLAWYRSLPLSCVEDVTLTIDGSHIDRADIRVRVGEREMTLDQLAPLAEDWWFVQDALTVCAAVPAAREAGARVDVDLLLATRIPYIVIGPQTALVQRTRVRKEVTVR